MPIDETSADLGSLGSLRPPTDTPGTNPSPTPSTLQIYFRLASSFLQLTAGLGAVLYGLGFVVVNAHLSRFGVYEFALFQPTYLIAGIGMALFGLGPLVASCSVLFLLQLRSMGQARVYFWWYFSFGLVTLIGTRFSIALLNTTLVSSSFHLARPEVRQHLWFFCVELSALLGIYALDAAFRSTPKRSRPLFVALVTPILVILFLSLAVTWSGLGYRGTAPILGGGEASEVSIYLSSDITRKAVQNIGVAINPNGWTEPMLLLADSLDTIVVAQNGRAVRLLRHDVVAVQYHRLVVVDLQTQGGVD